MEALLSNQNLIRMSKDVRVLIRADGPNWSKLHFGNVFERFLPDLADINKASLGATRIFLGSNPSDIKNG